MVYLYTYYVCWTVLHLFHDTIETKKSSHVAHKKYDQLPFFGLSKHEMFFAISYVGYKFQEKIDCKFCTHGPTSIKVNFGLVFNYNLKNQKVKKLEKRTMVGL